MALIKCFECNTKVSEYAEQCPKCGCPMHVIKKQQQNINPYLITFNGGETIDLTGIEQHLTAEDFNSSLQKVWHVLHEIYGACGGTVHTIECMIEFNNWKFPQNYQDLYEEWCEYNLQQIEKKEANKPKCPICGSTNVGSLSTFERLLGAFSMGRSRLSWVRVECKNCGHMW